MVFFSLFGVFCFDILGPGFFSSFFAFCKNITAQTRPIAMIATPSAFSALINAIPPKDNIIDDAA